jgi:fumarate reductase flavoprotein subunit
MKSKTINRILRLSLLFPAFLFNACDTAVNPTETSSDPSGTLPSLYTAGTYTEKADGYGGAIKVSTVFSGDNITKITIDSHKETTGREAVAAALEQIPPAIIEGQTLVVDVITGATATSKGILRAVEKCALKAGGESAVEKLKH